MVENHKALAVDAEPVYRKSLTDAVFDYLHKRIVAGKYKPGDWLRQEEISTQFSVSHTPVREALDRLVAVGLAERVTYRGVRVPELTHAEIVDAYIARLVVESQLARLAAVNATSEQIQKLESLVEQTRMQVTLEDMPAQRQLNRQIHMAIADSGSNLLMGKLFEVISNRFPDWRLYEYMFRHPELLASSLEREYQEHKDVLAALMDRNPNLAEQRVIGHIRNLSYELVAFLGVPADLIRGKEAQLSSEMFILENLEK